MKYQLVRPGMDPESVGLTYDRFDSTKTEVAKKILPLRVVCGGGYYYSGGCAADLFDANRSLSDWSDWVASISGGDDEIDAVEEEAKMFTDPLYVLAAATGSEDS